MVFINIVQNQVMFVTQTHGTAQTYDIFSSFTKSNINNVDENVSYKQKWEKYYNCVETDFRMTFNIDDLRNIIVVLILNIFIRTVVVFAFLMSSAYLCVLVVNQNNR